MKVKESLVKSVGAGALIGIGATIFMAAPDKTVGAFLFAIGLIAICIFKLNLYTGKIGYVFENKNYLEILLIWAGNLIGCFLTSFAVRLARPDLAEIANGMLLKKAGMSWWALLICAFFCGVIMFLAVDVYKRGNDFGRYLGIIFGIPVFILSGFEHSIADMCYFIYGIKTVEEFWFALGILVIVSIGNAIGGISAWLVLKDKKN